MSETNEREFLTYDQAVALLPDGDDIHTFRQAGFALLGADWSRVAILDALRAGKPELAGAEATHMRHGLVLQEPGRGALFIATRPAADPA